MMWKLCTLKVICCSTIFPFNSLCSNKNMLSCMNTDNNTHWIDLENDHNSSLSLKPSNLELLGNQFNNATPENSNGPEKVSSFKYYNIEEMYNIKIPHKSKSLFLFHINACSVNTNFDDLQHLVNITKRNFDRIAISETRITKQVSLSNNFNLNNYSLNLLLLRLLQVVPFF